MAWDSYRGRCIGRLNHFLDVYCGTLAASEATYKGNEVWLHGTYIATVYWSDRFGENDVPLFKFFGPNAEHYERQQALKCEEAQKECFHHIGERHEMHEDAVKMLKMVNEKAYHSASIHYQGYQTYIKSGDTAYLRLFEVGKHIVFEGFHMYFWHREMGCWLRAS